MKTPKEWTAEVEKSTYFIFDTDEFEAITRLFAAAMAEAREEALEPQNNMDPREDLIIALVKDRPLLPETVVQHMSVMLPFSTQKAIRETIIRLMDRGILYITLDWKLAKK